MGHSTLSSTNIFNNQESLIEGWYWALPSYQLKKGKIRHLNFLGRELAIYRGEDGKVRAMDAYCPHMGAHFAEGKVEGNQVRCFFHNWRYNECGELNEIPCRKKLDLKIKVDTYPCAEKYHMIWIWTGKEAKLPVPFIPELEHEDIDAMVAHSFEKKCHPHVVMINAIDAHHFDSVHNLPVNLYLQPKLINANCIQFNNTTTIPTKNIFLRFISRFYAKALTYSMCYWNASTGSVTVGPDFLHFHIIFALRPTKDGLTEGQTLLVTKKRKGLWGKILNPLILRLTKIVGDYFAKGDTQVFETIKFNFKHPIKEDHAIIAFIQHAEKQQTCNWGHFRQV